MITIKQLEDLATNDRESLLIVLELLLQKGIRMIQSEKLPDLMLACQSSHDGSFTEEKLCEIVTICKGLADLKLNTLIDYICWSNLKKSHLDEEFICPICGHALDYQDDKPDPEWCWAYVWKCPGCGATGKEGYVKMFYAHCDVKDAVGNPIPIPVEL